MFLRSPAAWLAALWIAAWIHVDWHLGRPAHHRLSFDLTYHWVTGVIAFVPVAWLVAWRWPQAFTRSSLVILGLGVALGQGLEPLGEVVLYPIGWEPFTNLVRWRIFAEFLLSGVISYLAAAAVLRRKAGRQPGTG